MECCENETDELRNLQGTSYMSILLLEIELEYKESNY